MTYDAGIYEGPVTDYNGATCLAVLDSIGMVLSHAETALVICDQNARILTTI